MAKPMYRILLADWEYLWAIDPAYDMTGGYVDSDDLNRLLHSPTRATAVECLESQIRYWLEVGPEYVGPWTPGDKAVMLASDPKIAEIAARYDKCERKEWPA